jgi:ABC-type hemin transport system ATPase subunit
VVISTHDVELAAMVADRILLLAHGEVVADDAPDRVLSGSLAYSTQMNRLFGPGYLTIEDVLPRKEPVPETVPLSTGARRGIA